MKDPEALNSTSERLEFVDSLRGFALFGVFWANLLIFSGIEYLSDEQRASLFPSGLDSISFFLERFFIENKFMGLFSFLFGISFWLFLSRVNSRSGAGTSLFYRRIFWLFIIGAVHGWLLWCFDILRFYALLAVLLPLFVRTAPKRLLSIGLISSILIPALVSGLRVWIGTPPPSTDFDAMALAAFSGGSYRSILIANWKYDWYLTISLGHVSYQVAVLGRLLLGLYAARTLALGNLSAHRKLLRTVLLIGGFVGLLGSTVFAGDFLAGAGASPLLSFIRRLILESGQLGLTLAYAAGLALLFLTVRGRSSLRLLAPIGRMALTWYLLQTVFGIWMFYGFARGPALMGKLGPGWLMALAFVGFAAQIMCARAWLKWFRFGPAEWLWRCLTYWRVQPFIALSSAPARLKPGPHENT